MPVLLFEFGSDVVLLNRALNVIVPTTVGITTMLVMPLPVPMGPKLQVTMRPDS